MEATSGIGQSCAFCGTHDVAWVHRLAPDLLAYRVHRTGYTLPTFWALCDRCEGVYTSGDEDVPEDVREPLAAFRRADRGSRRFDPEPPGLTEARKDGFVPLRELTGVADWLGPLWPSQHRRWLDELGPIPGEDEDDELLDRWLVRSPWPMLSAPQAIGALWRWVERDQEDLEPEGMRARALEFLGWTEPEALTFSDSEP